MNDTNECLYNKIAVGAPAALLRPTWTCSRDPFYLISLKASLKHLCWISHSESCNSRHLKAFLSTGGFMCCFLGSSALLAVGFLQISDFTTQWSCGSRFHVDPPAPVSPLQLVSAFHFRCRHRGSLCSAYWLSIVVLFFIYYYHRILFYFISFLIWMRFLAQPLYLSGFRTGTGLWPLNSWVNLRCEGSEGMSVLPGDVSASDRADDRFPPPKGLSKKLRIFHPTALTSQEGEHLRTSWRVQFWDVSEPLSPVVNEVGSLMDWDAIWSHLIGILGF